MMPPEAGVALAPFTTLGVGGAARWFTRATTIDHVAAAHRWSGEQSVPMFVLGGGSNLVVADRGFDGLVLQIAISGTECVPSGSDRAVRAGAGESWDEVVEATVAAGLAGLECLSGIPGTVGGTPVQNVGAYGQEVAGCITALTVFDRNTAQQARLTGDDCGFGYRTSRFKREDKGRFVVCDVTFLLRPGAPTVVYPDVIAFLEQSAIRSPTLGDVRRAVLTIRRRKGMVLDDSDPDTRSVGSFFMNPVVPEEVHARLASQSGSPPPAFAVPAGRVKIPAAWLIERAGFTRGYARGAVGVSSKHPLAIINRGGASAHNVLELAVEIKRRVLDTFGIPLRPEPVFVGFGDDPTVAYLTDGLSDG